MDINTVYSSLLYAHVTSGFISLISGLFAIIFRKKINLHRPFGKIYFLGMSLVFISSVLLCTIKFNFFLLCIGTFTYYNALTAYRALKLKQLHKEQRPANLDWFIEITAICFHIGLLIFGSLLLIKSNTAFGIISLVFGGFGLLLNRSNWMRFTKKTLPKKHWLLAHAGGMLGSYIGAFTAFMVNNNNRWMHLPEVIAWLGPTLLLTPLLMYELRRIKGEK